MRTELQDAVVRIAPVVRALILLSVVSSLAYGAYDVLFTLEQLSVLEADAPGFDAVDAINNLTSFALGIAWAVWFARVVREAARRGGAGLPSPYAAGLVQFFFPLTLFFPYRHMLKAAAALGGTEVGRPALLTYTLPLFSIAAAFFYLGDASVLWLAADLAWVAATVGGQLASLVVLRRVTAGVTESSVADVFA